MSNYPSKEQVQELMEYVGSNLHLPQLVQHFDKSNIYDTNEKLVGQWIDGKPIYQRVIYKEMTLTASTYNTIETFTNIDTPISYIGNITYKNNSTVQRRALPQSLANDVTATADVVFKNDGLLIHTGTNGARYSNPYICIQYTKTTDTALTYKIGTENDYSTDERLIGTWGNLPLYKKTISFGVLPNTTSKDVDTGLSNVNVRVIEGYAHRPSDGTTVPLPLAGTTLAQAINMSIRNNGAQVRINTGQDRSDMTNSYVTLYYTKNS